MMRHEPNLRIEQYRNNTNPNYRSPANVNWGTFNIPGKYGSLTVISSGNAEGNPVDQSWEHVSVSYSDRTPTWEDMDKVKRLFWADHETVIQFHPAESIKINFHPNCLHLWRLVDGEFPLPPTSLV